MTVGNVKFNYDGYKDGLTQDLQTSLEDFSFMETYERLNRESTQQKIRMLNKIKHSCKALQWDNTAVFNSLESFVERSLEFGDDFNISGTKALSKAPGIVKVVGRLILFIIRIVESIISMVVNFIKGVFRLISKAILALRTAGKNALKTPEEYVAAYGDNKNVEMYDISTYRSQMGITDGLVQIISTCKAVNAAVRYGAGGIYSLSADTIKFATKFPKSYLKPNATPEELLFESIGIKKVVGDPTTILSKVRADRVKELIFDCEKNKNALHNVTGLLTKTKLALKAFEPKSDTKTEDLETIRVVHLNLGKVLKEIINVSVFSMKLIKFGNDQKDGKSIYDPSSRMTSPAKYNRATLNEIKKHGDDQIDLIQQRHAQDMQRMNDFFENADVRDPNFVDDVVNLVNR